MFNAEPSRIFALPPGCDFPAELVAGLQRRLLGRPKQDMAKVTLYVNTARMRRRITDIFTQSGAGFLPKLRLIEDIDQDPAVDLPSPVSSLRRRLELAKMIAALLTAQPELAPRSAIFDLAESLANLLDEMQGEGVSPSVLAGLAVGDHSQHWEKSQTFLNIIAPLFAEGARRRAAVLQIAQLWETKAPKDPVIIAGSTGSRGSTALFMQAVAKLPQGAIVLPGYDFDLPSSVWDQMDDVLTAEDHPQFRFKRLMDGLGFEAQDVQKWTDCQPPAAGRNQLVSLSLRPAPITDQWLSEGPTLPDLISATQDITLIEAMTPRAEALAIALILRHAAAQGQKAALISPDRNLTRQVTAALDRWALIPDDSAGRPLALSAPGRYLRQIAGLFTERLTPDRLLALLKHPLTASGGDRGLHLKLTRDLELNLRRFGPAFPTAQDVMTWAKGQKTTGAEQWAAEISPIFTALQGDGSAPLADHVARHRDLAETLAGTDSGGLWQKDAGIKALSLMQALTCEAPYGGEISASDYRNLFDNLIQAEEVRDAILPHPNIMIWGTIEARVQGADLVILGGLNDTIWPRLPEPDPWLNRTMRKEAALLLPERQIGLSAHDYQQAMGAPQVVITRALRNAEAETVPSRWLNRLMNLMGGLPTRNGVEALKQMRARGDSWLQLAKALDAPTAQMRADTQLKPAKRPAPQPPVQARPVTLALTAIEKLIRDPYEVYARYILRLFPLDPLRPEATAQDRGIAVHRILQRFVQDRPETDPRGHLMRLTQDIMRAEIPFPAARALWIAKMERAADHFLTQDGRHGGASLAVESKGRQALDGLPFTLTGTPDRIDRLPDGRLHLIDYKTGTPPSQAMQKSFSKQLLLAAAMAERGGFADLGPNEVALITYIGLGAAQKIEETEITAELLAQEWAKLTKLISRYMDRDTFYAARRALFEQRYERSYDHLARFGEWQMTDRAEPVQVGEK